MRMATFDQLPTEIKSIIFKERHDKMKYEKYKRIYDICVLELNRVFELFNNENGFVQIDYKDEHLRVIQKPNDMRNIYPLHYYFLHNEGYIWDQDEIIFPLVKKLNNMNKNKKKQYYTIQNTKNKNYCGWSIIYKNKMICENTKLT